MDEIDKEANEILKPELKDKWDGRSYTELRSLGWYGYAQLYLVELANFERFSSSVKIEVMLKLAALDLRKGTKYPELVFMSCWYFPKKEALEKLVELAKQSVADWLHKEVAKSILEF